MGNFWANKLAGLSPEPQTAPTRAWWDRTPEEAPAAPEPYEYPRGVVGRVLDIQRDVREHRASRAESSCPECGSGNYMKPARSAPYRCFDCSFPVGTQEFTGQHAGAGTPHGKAVRQVTGSGWHPETIIGRIDNVRGR